MSRLVKESFEEVEHIFMFFSSHTIDNTYKMYVVHELLPLPFFFSSIHLTDFCRSPWSECERFVWSLSRSEYKALLTMNLWPWWCPTKHKMCVHNRRLWIGAFELIFSSTKIKTSLAICRALLIFFIFFYKLLHFFPHPLDDDLLTLYCD